MHRLIAPLIGPHKLAQIHLDEPSTDFLFP
ncbi:hypothetical protein CA13_07950 [Planctomycetes bacterium CA13]|uniref:Uncharacterized protein n=1 Tax=Novipirellula herctigrandis TaxID=2527986 RepID=A0A5C5YWL7_9BACT|nr:hypothetical protein CA13_07950 [Planctomycetes bacterium CA13]